VSSFRLSQNAAAHAWEQFADADPYLYIFTDMKRSDPQVFWESGESIVETELLPLVHAHSLRFSLALELGSGIGRLAFPLSRKFRRVVGVDIANGMVQRAKSLARDRGVDNACFIPIAGPEELFHLADGCAGSCDLIYSLLVLQHIADFSIIEGYLHVIRVLLHERGLAYLQFDTRPQDLAYRLKTRLPDFVLPRFWRRGIRRIRRSPVEIEACIRRAGMEIISQLSPNSAYHRYVLRLPRPRGHNE
jgi:SAM-dependent methyltransferase